MRRWPVGLWCVLLAGCAGRESALDPAGPQAGHIYDLWHLFAWTCGLVYLATLAALLLAWRRGRAGMAEERPRLVDTRLVGTPVAEARMGRTIAIATILTTVILTVFVSASFATDRSLFAIEREPGITIEVTANQWWWDLRYTGPDPGMIFRTANEIHVPTGTRVKLDLKSNDVIHSVWLPNITGKRDVIPGRGNSLVFRVDRPGEYRGQCAEFCGYQHAHMILTVIAESPEEFERWRAGQLADARAPASDEERQGLQVFLSAPCVMCHAIRGTAAGGGVAPDLTHLASRRTLAAGTIPNTLGYLAGWIADPQQIKPGNHMPLNLLPADQFQALATYLSHLE